jgi:hypothetical protein
MADVSVNRLRSLLASLALAGCVGIAGEGAQMELVGELDVFIVHLDDGTSNTVYRLNDEDGTVWELTFARDPSLATGDRIAVVGEPTDDGKFAVTELRTDDIAQSQEALTGNPVRTRGRLAVLLVQWTAPDSVTPEVMRDRVFSGTASTTAWFDENSYNLFELTGDVFGWYSVPAMTSCDFDTLGANARQAARDAGVDIDSYGQIAYYFPRTTQCGWSGLAYVGRPNRPAQGAWYNGASGCSVLAHELMHNYGANHSRSYECGTTALGAPATCSYSEYGDPFDPMGSGCTHTNGFQKGAQGWFGRCNTVTVTGESTLDIVPTELPSDAIQALRIPMDASLCPSGLTSCAYFVEYRRPIGIFGGIDSRAQPNPGVLIHIGGPVDFTGASRPASPYLLDMTPGSRTSSDFRDAALGVGLTFTDSTGISIRVDALGESAATVTVSFADGRAGGAVCIDGTTPPGGMTPPPPPPPLCPSGATAFDGRCYALTSSGTHSAVRTACAALGTGWRVVTVESAAENEFVRTLKGASATAWIGARDNVSEGRWEWNTGQVFWTGGLTGAPVAGLYTNFAAGEPNDSGGADCLRMPPDGTWMDLSCSSSFIGVCERD